MTNAEELLDCIEIEPATTTKHSIIWLHGLGADGHDFVPIVSSLNLPPSSAIRFIFPHAPILPVTVNNGYEMRAWYDIVSLEVEKHMDEKGLLASQKMVEQLIAKEITRGIESKNILLAGFSQGAVIAYMTGLSYPKALAGIIALSGYLPFAEKLLASASEDKHHMPIFIGHGTEDPIVSFHLGKTADDTLRQADFNVTFKSYDMPHTVNEEEVKDLRHWLQALWP